MKEKHELILFIGCCLCFNQVIAPEEWIARASGYDGKEVLEMKIPPPIVQERHFVGNGCYKQYVGSEGKKKRKRREIHTVQSFKEKCDRPE